LLHDTAMSVVVKIRALIKNLFIWLYRYFLDIHCKYSKNILKLSGFRKSIS
jgi:hypothetical protein